MKNRSPGRSDEPASVKVPISMLPSERDEVDAMIEKINEYIGGGASRSSIARGALLRLARKLPEEPTSEQLAAIVVACMPDQPR